MWIFGRLLASVVLKAPPGLFPHPRSPLPNLELRLLHCTCCWRVRIPITDLSPNALLAEPAQRPYSHDLNSEPKLDSIYTPEQRDAILQLLNTASEGDLSAVKMLRGRKSANIMEYRSRNGPFKDLESVVNVPLLKHKSAIIAFNSILNPVGNRERRKAKIHLAKFIRPEMDKALLEEATSIVSIVCGTNKIAWTHMDRAMTVLDWQQEECHSFMKGTYMASSYLEDISGVVSKIPEADFFLVEKTSVSMQNATLFPVLVHLRTVEAMLFALLSARREAGAPPNVLNMMRSAVGRHFDLMLGETRTSGSETVRKMMAEAALKQAPRVTFPRELLLRYRGAFQINSKNKGEELCNALLQAVAFYELLVV